MNHIASFILILLVGSNMITAFIKSPIRVINLILLLQFAISYWLSTFLIPDYNKVLVTSNILIDVISSRLIFIFWKKAIAKNLCYNYLIDMMQGMIWTMVLTHVLAAFDRILSLEEYFSILNTLSLINAILGLTGGIMGLVHGLGDNKNYFHFGAYQGHFNNKRGTK